MRKNKLALPILKWVGGKRQLMTPIKSFLPTHVGTYCEPFVGGGAVLFELQPTKGVINDLNEDLIDV
jgi:Site-specific DNA methylase